MYTTEAFLQIRSIRQIRGALTLSLYFKNESAYSGGASAAESFP